MSTLLLFLLLRLHSTKIDRINDILVLWLISLILNRIWDILLGTLENCIVLKNVWYVQRNKLIIKRWTRLLFLIFRFFFWFLLTAPTRTIIDTFKSCFGHFIIYNLLQSILIEIAFVNLIIRLRKLMDNLLLFFPCLFLLWVLCLTIGNQSAAITAN